MKKSTCPYKTSTDHELQIGSAARSKKPHRHQVICDRIIAG